MDQIELEAGGLGSRSGNRSMGEIGVMYFDFWVSNVNNLLQPFHVDEPPLLNLFVFFLSFFLFKSETDRAGAEELARG